MKTKAIVAIAAALFAVVSAYAVGPKGGDNRVEEHLALSNDYTDVKKGDQLIIACKTCDAMSAVTVETNEAAAAFCQEGKEVTCPSCGTKALAHRLDKDRPRPSGKPARNIVYVNQHGEDCLIVSKVVSAK